MRFGTEHSLPAAQVIVLIPTARCALGARAFSQQQQQQQQQKQQQQQWGVAHNLPGGATERTFVLMMWRREWTVNRAVSALDGADTALYRPQLYIGR